MDDELKEMENRLKRHVNDCKRAILKELSVITYQTAYLNKKNKIAKKQKTAKNITRD